MEENGSETGRKLQRAGEAGQLLERVQIWGKKNH